MNSTSPLPTFAPPDDTLLAALLETGSVFISLFLGGVLTYMLRSYLNQSGPSPGVAAELEIDDALGSASGPPAPILAITTPIPEP